MFCRNVSSDIKRVFNSLVVIGIDFKMYFASFFPNGPMFPTVDGCDVVNYADSLSSSLSVS